jgi:uncharacterized protein (TIGR02453 family)
MQYFSLKTQKFLGDLEINNNRDWFNENKSRFKEDIELPFEKFISDLIEELKKLNPNLNISAKEAIFRIYRDIRFSKDKTPYKIHMSAIISQGARKDYTSPGMYIELKANEIRLYFGVYEPDSKSLLRLRTFIAHHSIELNKLITAKKFIDTFGEIKGEKSKVIPKEFKAIGEQQNLIYNKAFYFVTVLDEQWIGSDKLIKEVIRIYKLAQPMNDYLAEALL